MRSLLLLATALAVPAQAQIDLHEISLPDPSQYGQFGTSVTGVLDVDGDGVNDFLISADQPFRSSASVYSGANGVLLYRIAAPSAPLYFDFHTSVAGLEDIDGDGLGDLLVGDPEYSNWYGYEGQADVYSGATGIRLRTISSPGIWANGRFGNSVAGLPDVDGDGIMDFLIGSPGAGDDHGAGPGEAYVFSGASGAHLHTLTSPAPSSAGKFGRAVSVVPDVDGDGVAELLVGEPFRSGISSGRIHLFSGASGAHLYSLTSPIDEEGNLFGAAVQGIEDVDGDGRGDLLVGAPGASPDGSPAEAGRAYVFSGASGTLLREFASPNEEEEGAFGSAVAAVPDLSGDGDPDFLIGAVRAGLDSPQTPRGEGRAYAFDGVTGALLETVLPPDGPSPGSFAHAVAGLEDVDGDGLGDVLLGAPNDTLGGVHQAGRAYYSGTPDAFPRVVVEAEPLGTPVPRGDTLRVDVTVTNPSAHAATFDLRFVALGSNDPWAPATFTHVAFTDTLATGLTLAPGETVSLVAMAAVPMLTPPVDYVGRVQAVQTGGGTLGADAFAFDVNLGVDLTVTAEPLNSPVLRGDTLRAAITVENPSAQYISVDLHFRGAGPYTFTYPLGPLTLAPEETALLEAAVPVPEDAAVGTYVATVEALRPGGDRAGYDTFFFHVAAGVAVEGDVPMTFALHPPHPNPARSRVDLAFHLPAPSAVRIAVYDLLGREVAVLAEGAWESGRHAVALEAGALAPGVYAVRLTAGEAVGGEATALRLVTITR